MKKNSRLKKKLIKITTILYYYGNWLLTQFVKDNGSERLTGFLTA